MKGGEARKEGRKNPKLFVVKRQDCGGRAAVDEVEVDRTIGGCLPARHRGRGAGTEKSGATRLTTRSGAMPGGPDGHDVRTKRKETGQREGERIAGSKARVE